jgi:hypothetical protein
VIGICLLSHVLKCLSRSSPRVTRLSGFDGSGFEIRWGIFWDFKHPHFFQSNAIIVAHISQGPFSAPFPPCNQFIIMLLFYYFDTMMP